jgi:MFS superfamily sulfate permease-like transporter
MIVLTYKGDKMKYVAGIICLIFMPVFISFILGVIIGIIAIPIMIIKEIMIEEKEEEEVLFI